MLHPHTEVRFINDKIGSGIFATRHIAKGTVVWALDEFDRLYDEEAVRRMPLPYQEILERYCFRNHRGQWVFCWDNTRFVNHSFHPTCITTPYQFEIAVRDIKRGEQITNDYGFFNIIEPFDCIPEPGCERTTVMPDDILRFYEVWDAQLEEAFRFFDKVPQPLSKFMRPEIMEKAKRISCGAEAMDSIRQCYFDPASAAV